MKLTESALRNPAAVAVAVALVMLFGLLGSAVDVGLPRGPQREVVAVPRDALVLRREGDYVLRVGARDVAERVGVEAGDTVDGQVEVRGDVRPGDRLIVRGAERVQPGQTVRVLAAAPLAQATQARAAR
ncbi:MAG: hypothetical protein ACOY9B_06630 [Pseudomonadota bacterium]